MGEWYENGLQRSGMEEYELENIIEFLLCLKVYYWSRSAFFGQCVNMSKRAEGFRDWPHWMIRSSFNEPHTTAVPNFFSPESGQCPKKTFLLLISMFADYVPTHRTLQQCRLHPHLWQNCSQVMQQQCSSSLLLKLTTKQWYSVMICLCKLENSTYKVLQHVKRMMFSIRIGLVSVR